VCRLEEQRDIATRIFVDRIGISISMLGVALYFIWEASLHKVTVTYP
jgi:hypothetical protein